MLNAIDLNMHEKSEFINDIGGELKLLNNIKNINILVGENNCGKSRFLRSLIKSNSAIFLSDSKVKKDEFQSIRSRLKIFCDSLHIKEPYFMVSHNHDYLSPCELYAYYQNQFDYYGFDKKEYSYSNYNLVSRINADLKRLYDLIVWYEDSQNRNKKSMRRVYIPVLRGVECFSLYFDKDRSKRLDSISMDGEQRIAFESYKLNADQIYANKVSSAYGIKADNIFTGENLFQAIINKLLGTESDRHFIKTFEDFISENFYDGEGFSIIPDIKAGYLKVKIGNSLEKPLHDLGDGIKQIICILYKVFECRNSDSIICIEEPEINLHPGYQRKLIELLQLEDFKKIYFFISTHSNHIVDGCFECDNISVFKFINTNKNQNNCFKVSVSKPNDIDILNQLGVNNSSVFMSNCTIWVEGISDKVYLNKYLKIYSIASKKRRLFKEGVDYSFVEYGGNNIVHWAFNDSFDVDSIKASGITNRAFIIVDNDDDSISKRARKIKLKSLFGDNFLELPVREIENTIGNKLLEKHFSHVYSNFKTVQHNSDDSIESKSVIVWKYIDSHYQLPKKYCSKDGRTPTIPKLSFAKQICNDIEIEEDLSVTAYRIAKRLYEYIQQVYEEINS